MDEGDESSGGGVRVWEERKVGSEPRKEFSQADLLGETSNSLEAREAIWRRRDWALERGGRRERRVEDVVVVDKFDCWLGWFDCWIWEDSLDAVGF